MTVADEVAAKRAQLLAKVIHRACRKTHVTIARPTQEAMKALEDEDDDGGFTTVKRKTPDRRAKQSVKVDEVSTRRAHSVHIRCLTSPTFTQEEASDVEEGDQQAREGKGPAKRSTQNDGADRRSRRVQTVALANLTKVKASELSFKVRETTATVQPHRVTVFPPPHAGLDDAARRRGRGRALCGPGL
jgi:hypothetical protein